MPSLSSKITAERGYFIKLGRNGRNEKESLEDGTIRLDHYLIPHDLGLNQNTPEIINLYMKDGREQRIAARFAREVMNFYTAGPDCLWVTFFNDHMYWSFADEDVHYLGSDESLNPAGSRFRKTLNGWKNTGILGTPLHKDRLSGKTTPPPLTAVSEIKSDVLSYILRKINEEEHPEILRAEQSSSQLKADMIAIIKLLKPNDFELFIDLIFSRTGWHRTSFLGGSQKTTDFYAEQPLTGETAVIQVKSKSHQAELNQYINKLQEFDADRIFYAYHSTRNDQDLQTDNEKVQLFNAEKLADLALKSGLIDWLILKAF